MKLISNKQNCPPGRWKYQEPSTGVEFTAFDYQDLRLRVLAHRRGNGIELSPLWNEELENYICEQNPYLDCFDPEKIGTTCALTLEVLRRFLGTMWAWLKGGGGLVEQEVAESRAAICVTCPKNIVVQGCWGCAGLTGLVAELKGDKSTKYDDQLQNCSICCCVNRVKIWMPLESMKSDLEYPSFCWLTKETESAPSTN